MLNSRIGNGDLDGISDLLSQNVGLNPREGVILDIKHIPLFRAVEKDDCRIVELLLKTGADPNILGMRTKPLINMHIPPLHLAVKHAVYDKSYSIFEKLLQYGANPYVTIEVYKPMNGFFSSWGVNRLFDYQQVPIFVRQNGCQG